MFTKILGCRLKSAVTYFIHSLAVDLSCLLTEKSSCKPS